MKEKNDIKKVVLAYSGGLDTSVMITWLKENYNNCEVIAVTADVGQGEYELEGLEEKAINSGASKIYIKDLKDEMVKDYIIPTIKSGATYEGQYLLGTPFTRPLIAKHLSEIALKENADAVCHGATGKGNDQVRFELAIKALAPQLQIIAPWRTWELKSREDEIEYAEKHNIPLKINRKTNYSKDKNLWHLSHEGLDLENPANEPKYDEILEMGVTPHNAEWYTPLKDSLLAFIEETQKTVTGSVTLKLYKGNIITVSVQSPYSLYSEKTASFGEDEDFDHNDSAGFISLYSLPTRIRATMLEKNKKED